MISLGSPTAVIYLCRVAAGRRSTYKANRNSTSGSKTKTTLAGGDAVKKTGCSLKDGFMAEGYRELYDRLGCAWDE